MNIKTIPAFLTLLAVLFVAGCSTPPKHISDPVTQREVTDLTRDIQALGPDVDPEEAARAAEISLLYSRQLAKEYEITDSPLVHNMKVNQGLRPRGLCWHWAEDIEKRLRQENFQTLDIHRAIANAGQFLRIDHSTTLVSQKGDDMFDGLVVDPWRYGGVLFWGDPKLDTKYDWRPQLEVHAEKRRQRERRESQFKG